MTMRGILLTGHGGMDKLEWREDIPVPTLSEGEVLIKVGACGLNNTDINTRVGWYSKTATSGSDNNAQEEIEPDDGGWGGTSLRFPRIQGADIAGEVVEVKGSQFQHLLGETVMVDPWIRPLEHPERYKVIGYLGSEIDGGFAEYTKVPGNAVHPVKSEYSLIELATFATSSVTAENMLDRARVKTGDVVLITGASGGVGSALIQLANRRDARTIAVSSKGKIDEVKSIEPDEILLRESDNFIDEVMSLTSGSGVSVVADVVGGNIWPQLLEVLNHGGCYVCSGAIAGPMVEFDLRTFYLKDLTLVGATIVPPGTFGNLVSYIERKEIKPLLAESYHLKDFKKAQMGFLEKSHFGNIVVYM